MNKKSKSFEFSKYDWKSLLIYTIYIWVMVFLSNMTWITEFLNNYLSSEIVTMIISILWVMARKFITDYKKND